MYLVFYRTAWSPVNLFSSTNFCLTHGSIWSSFVDQECWSKTGRNTLVRSRLTGALLISDMWPWGPRETWWWIFSQEHVQPACTFCLSPLWRCCLHEQLSNIFLIIAAEMGVTAKQSSACSWAADTAVHAGKQGMANSRILMLHLCTEAALDATEYFFTLMKEKKNVFSCPQMHEHREVQHFSAFVFSSTEWSGNTY